MAKSHAGKTFSKKVEELDEILSVGASQDSLECKRLTQGTGWVKIYCLICDG